MTNFDNPAAAEHLVGLWDFRDGAETQDTGLADGVAQNGEFEGDAGASGDQLHTDGNNDFFDVDGDDSPFDLTTGTVEVQFTQDAHVGSSPDTIVNRGEAADANDEGFFEIRVTEDGEVQVMHCMPGGIESTLSTDSGFFSPGDTINVVYSFDEATGATLTVQNLTNNTEAMVETTQTGLTLDIGDNDDENFTFGAREEDDGDYDHFFDGSIDYVAVYNTDNVPGIGGPNSGPDYIVEGTSGADLIDVDYTGDPEGDLIDALDDGGTPASNDDVVEAGAGDDTVQAGDGDDTVFGGTGDDFILGDTNNNQDGDDLLLGEAGEDTLCGLDGDDTLDGGAGDDLLEGMQGDDLLLGGSGNDLGFGDDGDDTIFGDAGGQDDGSTPDRFPEWPQDISNVVFYFDTDGDGTYDVAVKVEDFPDEGTSSFISNDLDDYYDQMLTFITDSNPSLDGLDPVLGVSIKGGTQETEFYAVDGNDNGLIADSGPTINTGPGTEELSYSDFYAGYDATLAPTGGGTPEGAGDDTLSGGAGDDLIYGNGGDDSIDGNSGDDTLNGDDPEAGTVVSGNLIFNGSFEITSGMTTTGYGFRGEENDGVPGWTDANGNEIDFHNDGRGGVNATDGDNWLDLEASPGNARVGQIVNGVQEGETYNLSFDAGDKSDEAQSGSGENLIEVYWGGELIATVDPEGGQMDAFSFDVIGGAGDGTNKLEFVGLGVEDNFGASIDNVVLVQLAGEPGIGGDDTINGGTGADVIDGQGGDDSITGGSGNDMITGGDGADDMSGGDDRDTFIGGNDGDVVDGGTGSTAAGDVDDFDTLDLTGSGPFQVVNETPDADGNSTSGTIEFLNADGTPNGSSMTFTEIEEIIGDRINQGPEANDDTVTVAEDETATFNPTSDDTDPDGDTLTVTSIGTPANGTLTDNLDGTYTYEPDDDFNGTDSVTYTVDDGNGGMDTATITFNVTPVNDDPDAMDDSNSTAFETAVSINLLANDSDVDVGDIVTVDTATVPASEGTLVETAPGVYDFTPADGFEGTATVTYTVSDGNGGTDSAIHTIEVGADPTPQDGIVDGEETGEVMELGYDDANLPTDNGGDLITNDADIIEGNGGDDIIDGAGGDDTITGGAGDSITGGGGADSIFIDQDEVDENGDNDTAIFVEGNNFGDDNDTLDLTDFLAHRNLVETDDNDPANPSTSGTVEVQNNELEWVTVTFGEIENLLLPPAAPTGIVDGEEFGEVMELGYDDSNLPTDGGGDMITDGDDSIEGNGGDDSIQAEGGDDSVDGGTGDDTVRGNAGDDSLFGGTGDDSISGGAGDDTIDGGDDDDTITGGSGDDVIDGGQGDDTITGSSGADSITDLDGDNLINSDNPGSFNPDLGTPIPTGPTNPFIIGTPDANPDDNKDTITTGDGDDTINAGDDADLIDAGNGDNVIDGGTDRDTITTGSGDDSITGGEGDDLINSGDGDDTIDGGVGSPLANFIDAPNPGFTADPILNNGDDTINAGAGDDVVNGEDDNDEIDGGTGDDTLDGGIDDDTVLGGAGDDVIIGGQGADSLDGGTGDDVFNVGTFTDPNGTGDYQEGLGDTVVGGEDVGDGDIDTLDLSGGGSLKVVFDDSVDPTGTPGESGTVIYYTDATQTTESGRLVFKEIENVIPCFTPGAMIATPRGEVPVETLREGDKVITRDNGIQEICWTGSRTLNRAELAEGDNLKPILIKAGSLGRNLPERDMLVSPQHRVLITGETPQLYFEESEVLVAAKHLLGKQGVSIMDTMRTTYIHFMFERHEVVLSDGAWTESFQPGEQSLGSMGEESRGEIFALFPELLTEGGLTDYAAARRSLKAHEAKLLQL